MFFSSSEHKAFLSAFCYRCRKYKTYKIESYSCPVENKIALCQFTGKKEDFPYEELTPVSDMCRYFCISFEKRGQL